MIQKVDHIGIAVKNLDEQVKFYTDLFGVEPGAPETVKEQKVTVVMFKVGDINIELLQATSPDSPIAKFINKKGEGIHHIAYSVANIKDQLSALKKRNVRLIDENPKQGTHGTLIAFAHPSSTFGVLTEFCQKIE